MPTLLHLLDYPIPPSVEGRVLHEALAQPQVSPETQAIPQAYSTEVMTSTGLYRQHLATTRVGTTTYLERAWTA
jgi:hypothetical protein